MTEGRTPRPCETCGVVFVPRRPGGKARRAGTRWGIYCGKTCQSKGQVAAKPAPAPKPTAECAVCRGLFTKRTSRQIVCGDACAQQRSRDVARAHNIAQHENLSRTCAECGASFVSEYGAKRRVYCTEACLLRATKRTAKGVRRARTRGATAQPVQAMRVFVRDGWRCHLCGRKTRAEKRGTAHQLAPELDHIVALALGGAHSYANTACACRRCNMKKGASSRGQPSLLACL